MPSSPPVPAVSLAAPSPARQHQHGSRCPAAHHEVVVDASVCRARRITPQRRASKLLERTRCSSQPSFLTPFPFLPCGSWALTAVPCQPSHSPCVVLPVQASANSQLCPATEWTCCRDSVKTQPWLKPLLMPQKSLCPHLPYVPSDAAAGAQGLLLAAVPCCGGKQHSVKPRWEPQRQSSSWPFTAGKTCVFHPHAEKCGKPQVFMCLEMCAFPMHTCRSHTR